MFWARDIIITYRRHFKKAVITRRENKTIITIFFLHYTSYLVLLFILLVDLKSNVIILSKWKIWYNANTSNRLVCIRCEAIIKLSFKSSAM